MRQTLREDELISPVRSHGLEEMVVIHPSVPAVAHLSGPEQNQQVTSDMAPLPIANSFSLAVPVANSTKRLEAPPHDAGKRTPSSPQQQIDSRNPREIANLQAPQVSPDNAHQRRDETTSPWNPPTAVSSEDEPVPSWEADSIDGPLRFWGPTTRRHSQLPPAKPGPIESEGDLQSDTITNLDSVRLRSVLFSAFWSWNSRTLAVNIVNESMFTSHGALGRPSQYHSKFLEDAILACSSRMSSSAAIRRLGQKFVDRAKASLVQQLESPTIASLQGLLLVGDFESTSGRERIGWTYGGKH